jgi:flagellar basal-body rod protein FlgG
MAIAALNSAATGLRALSTKIDVIANNLANAETNSFKRSRANFEDLMYTTVKQPGATNAAGDIAPAGIQIGHGVRISNTQLDFEQGPMESTDRQLDVAINGQGFFRVKIMDSVGDGTAYTRSGNFFLNTEGELVLGMKDGPRLLPPITLPANTVDVNIAEDGTVSASVSDAIEPTPVGRLEMARFINPQGLKTMGGNLFLETAASGPPVSSNPNEDGAGYIQQGFLEGSNVDPVKELVGLIKTQRSFELNSQSIQTADQALQTVANLRRG